MLLYLTITYLVALLLLLVRSVMKITLASITHWIIRIIATIRAVIMTIKQDIVFPTNILRQANSNNLQTVLQTVFVKLHAIPANFQFYCIAHVSTVDLQQTVQTSTYAVYTSGVWGLRAPPAI